jgi:hypothetical protein
VFIWLKVRLCFCITFRLSSVHLCNGSWNLRTWLASSLFLYPEPLCLMPNPYVLFLVMTIICVDTGILDAWNLNFMTNMMILTSRLWTFRFWVVIYLHLQHMESTFHSLFATVVPVMCSEFSTERNYRLKNYYASVMFSHCWYRHSGMKLMLVYQWSL